MAHLDRKDREILHQLDIDARQPNSRIAKKLCLSKEVVGYRIGRMLRDGVIDGFYALVDMTRLGYLNARIFIKLKGASPKEEEAMVREFMADPRCWWVNSISGSFSDMGIAFWVKDIADFQAYKERLLEKYRGKMEFYHESIYSRLNFWRRGYLSGNGAKGKCDFIPGSSPAESFDVHDIRILSTLSGDARLPFVELAARAGLSETAAKRRIKRLKEKKILLGFRPKINLSKIGYYWYKAEFQLEDYNAKKAMLSYFGSHPNIIYAYESIGGKTDLEVEMEVEGHEKFREILDAIRTRFKGAIRTYVYYIWSAEHKIVFFPPEEFFTKVSQA